MPTVITNIGNNTWRTFLSQDEVEIGDITSPNFKPHIKHKRWNGKCDHALSFPSTGGIATYDGVNQRLGFVVNDYIRVEINGMEPDSERPEGAVEFNVILTKKPQGNNNQITLKLESDTIGWEKILPLDEEWDEAKCVAKWNKKGEYPGPYIITPTTITETTTGEVMLTRAAELCNSIRGKANQCYQVTTNHGEIKKGPRTGQQLKYTKVSRTTAHIKRRKAIDSDGWEVEVEDMDYNPATGDLTFTLPSDFIKNATYPIYNAVGVDPAYTEDMASGGQPGSDGTWYWVGLNSTFGTSFGSGDDGVVLEFMLENQQKGAENLAGVRNVDSSTNRTANIHESEPNGGTSGATHCRMFVVGTWDTTPSSDIWIEYYAEDVSDLEIYLLGYWENVGFTEMALSGMHSSSTAWVDIDTTAVQTLPAADRVYHIAAMNGEDGTAGNMGVRAGGSSLSRYISIDEAESGGYCILDFLAKADATSDIEIYGNTSLPNSIYRVWGYFGEELDFVELWQLKTNTASYQGWADWDLTSYLDQDGRVVDVSIVHAQTGSNNSAGVRGNGSSAARYFGEHEAEGGGTAGFSMTATSDSNGIIEHYSWLTIGEECYFYLAGYFLPAAAGTEVSATLESFTLTSYNPTVNAALAIDAGNESFTLTAYATTVELRNDVDVSAGTEAFTLTTYNPSINAKTSITTTLESFTLTEYNPGISRRFGVDAGTEAFTLTAYNPTLTYSVNVAASNEAFTLTAYNPSINAALAIDAGTEAFTLTAYNPTVNAALNVSAGNEAFTLTAYNPAISKSTAISAGTEAFTLTTYQATVVLGVRISVTVESFTLTAYSTTLTFDTKVAATCATFTLTEYKVSLGGATNVSAGTEAFTLTAYSPTVNAETSISAGTEAFTLTAYNPNVNRAINISAGNEAFTITAYNPAITLNKTVAAGTEAFTLTTYNPEVEIEVEIAAGTVAMTMTAYAVSIAYDRNVAATVAILAMASYRATVSIGGAAVAVAKVNSVTWAAIAKVNGVSKASIKKLSGVEI